MLTRQRGSRARTNAPGRIRLRPSANGPAIGADPVVWSTDNGDMASADGLNQGTNVGQRAAVAATIRLLGGSARARFVPTESEDEIWLVLPDSGEEAGLRDAEQVLTQVLGRKVWITRDSGRYAASPHFP